MMVGTMKSLKTGSNFTLKKDISCTDYGGGLIVSLCKKRFKNHFIVLVIIFLSFFIGVLIIYGYAALGIALYVALIFCFALKKAENIFFCWLLLSPLFSIDSLSFLRINTHPILTFDRVIIGALILFVLVEVAFKRRSLLPINKLEKTMVLFSLIIIFSIITKTTVKTSGARVFIDSYMYPFIIYFLSKNLISNEKNFNRFINSLVIIGSYISLMGIYEYIIGRDILPSQVGLVERAGWVRVNGPYNIDSTFGVNVAFFFMIILFKFITSKKIKIKNINRVFYFLLLCISTLGLSFNFYRGIWISFLAGIFSFFVIRRKGLGKLIYSILLLTILLMPIFEKISNTRLYQNRILNMNTIESRLAKYKRAYEYFKRSPFNGVGFENYPETEHNYYIYVLCETGIIGIVSLVILISMIIFYNYKYLKGAKTYLDKEFSAITSAIVIIFLVSWASQNLGYYAHINTNFYAILGVVGNRVFHYENRKVPKEL